jgi:DNA-binding HxlR family transcriptional regulator
MLGDFKHAIRAVGGKWKLEIMFVLRNSAMRFGALRRSLDGITQHMLTMQLRNSNRTDWCGEPPTRRSRCGSNMN